MFFSFAQSLIVKNASCITVFNDGDGMHSTPDFRNLLYNFFIEKQYFLFSIMEQYATHVEKCLEALRRLSAFIGDPNKIREADFSPANTIRLQSIIDITRDKIDRISQNEPSQNDLAVFGGYLVTTSRNTMDFMARYDIGSEFHTLFLNFSNSCDFLHLHIPYGGPQHRPGGAAEGSLTSAAEGSLTSAAEGSLMGAAEGPVVRVAHVDVVRGLPEGRRTLMDAKAKLEALHQSGAFDDSDLRLDVTHPEVEKLLERALRLIDEVMQGCLGQQQQKMNSLMRFLYKVTYKLHWTNKESWLSLHEIRLSMAGLMRNANMQQEYGEDDFESKSVAVQLKFECLICTDRLQQNLDPVCPHCEQIMCCKKCLQNHFTKTTGYFVSGVVHGDPLSGLLLPTVRNYEDMKCIMCNRKNVSLQIKQSAEDAKTFLEIPNSRHSTPLGERLMYNDPTFFKEMDDTLQTHLAEVERQLRNNSRSLHNPPSGQFNELFRSMLRILAPRFEMVVYTVERCQENVYDAWVAKLHLLLSPIFERMVRNLRSLIRGQESAAGMIKQSEAEPEVIVLDEDNEWENDPVIANAVYISQTFLLCQQWKDAMVTLGGQGICDVSSLEGKQEGVFTLLKESFHFFLESDFPELDRAVYDHIVSVCLSETEMLRQFKRCLLSNKRRRMGDGGNGGEGAGGI